MATEAVDGNGIVSAIPDGLRLLLWGFDVAQPPPAPFPDCGTDPQDPHLDLSLSCDTNDDEEHDGGQGCSGDPTP